MKLLNLGDAVKLKDKLYAYVDIITEISHRINTNNTIIKNRIFRVNLKYTETTTGHSYKKEIELELTPQEVHELIKTRRLKVISDLKDMGIQV